MSAPIEDQEKGSVPPGSGRSGDPERQPAPSSFQSETASSSAHTESPSELAVPIERLAAIIAEMEGQVLTGAEREALEQLIAALARLLD